MLAPHVGEGDSVRKGVKRVVSAVMFRNRELQKLPGGTKLIFPEGWDGKRLGHALKKRRPAGAAKFGTAIGYYLLWRQREVLLEALWV